MKTISRRFRLAGLLLAASVAGSVGAPVDPFDAPTLAALTDLIESGHAGRAERELQAMLADDPGNADVLNLLGYANRKLKRYPAARGYYDRALRLDPRHKGALEYRGELELETGHPEAARALLARLEAVCPEGCHELDDLRAAFAASGL